MTQATTITVRLKGQLSEFVAANIGEQGSYDNVSEYIRDLIRRDKERVESLGFETLKAELKLAFDAPESSYRSLTALDIINRNKQTA
ncbi:addiction module antitoxin [Pseudomonas sp. C27(2019)]|uniref:ribbon-helix-helix domain-containing protein n=1 Tax=Pseudomonas sp. C27(2019) TaxID=2604941 RepID=UPI001243B093|nr:addiction module antitoxin [Pseudomonas sp. C27(2019)]QEY59900.1 addiction module antitoxin [Pseudomonas sp. C27(2019)]